MIGSGPPSFYNYNNVATTAAYPNTVHVKNTGLSNFFKRYLLQKAMSVFRFKIPDIWDRDYFLYVLYIWGFIAVIEDSAMGVIPQGCSLRGYDVFYRPKEVIISNPALENSKLIEREIGKNCTLLKLQPDYGGIYDLVSYYGDLMAVCSEALGANLFNSQLSYVFGAKNKAAAETYKKMYDMIHSGDPAVVIDKNLFNENGEPSWIPFNAELQKNYLSDKLIAQLKMIEYEFDKHVGIPSVNTDKKERLITDEVTGNNVGVAACASIWLESLQKGCKDTREMFGIDISVDWRVKPDLAPEQPVGGEQSAS